MVADMFRAQHYPNKRLVIVENGDAIGATREAGVVPHMVTTSEPHVSHARNAGIDLVRDLGGEWTAQWDDDDYYGPHYLSELAFSIVNECGDLLGKRRHFVAFRDHGLYLFNAINQNKRAHYLHGPTLCFNAQRYPDVRYSIVEEGEDLLFCDAMQRRGAFIYGQSIHHFCYTRGHHVDHTFKGSPEFVARISKGNDFVYWLGHRVPAQVIDGTQDWRRFVLERQGDRTESPIIPGDARPVLRIEGTHVSIDLQADYIH